MEKLEEFAALIKPLFNAKGIFKMKAYRFGIAANSDNRLLFDIENTIASSALAENGDFDHRERFEFEVRANNTIFNSENMVSNRYHFLENKSAEKETVSENSFFQNSFDNVTVINAFEKIPPTAVSSYFKGGINGKKSGMAVSSMIKNSLLFSSLNMSNAKFGGGADALGGEMMKYGGRAETMAGSMVGKGENRFFEQRFSFGEKVRTANSNLEKGVYNFYSPTDNARQEMVKTKKSFLEENYAAVDIDQIEDALAKRIHSQLLAGFPMF